MKIYGILSKHDAHNLKWNRFFNKHGTKGGHIPLDLRMEQLNKIVKTMWRSLGPISTSPVARVANTVDDMEQILDRVDEVVIFLLKLGTDQKANLKMLFHRLQKI